MGGTGRATSPTAMGTAGSISPGRSNEWLRVDGENFAAAPVEAIIGRFPGVRSVAVYAVPDDPVGDRVMAAIELEDDRHVDPAEFDRFPRRPARPRHQVESCSSSDSSRNSPSWPA